MRSFQWSFGPNSVWASMITTVGKMHPALHCKSLQCPNRSVFIFVQVSQLKHQLKEIEQQAKANLVGKQVVSEKDELIQRMKQQIKDHEGHSKVSEVKIIEAGRRIDQLIDQNNEYQKVSSSA